MPKKQNIPVAATPAPQDPTAEKGEAERPATEETAVAPDVPPGAEAPDLVSPEPGVSSADEPYPYPGPVTHEVYPSVYESPTISLTEIKNINFIDLDGRPYRLDDYKAGGIYILRPYYGPRYTNTGSEP